MRVTADVTRYATGDVRRTCVIPTDPTRTEPTKYSLVTFPSILTKVTRGAAAPIVTPGPLAHPDAMDGLTISQALTLDFSPRPSTLVVAR